MGKNSMPGEAKPFSPGLGHFITFYKRELGTSAVAQTVSLEDELAQFVPTMSGLPPAGKSPAMSGHDIVGPHQMDPVTSAPQVSSSNII